MIGETFAAEAGITLLSDPHPLELYGENVLLSHGDAMCTTTSSTSRSGR